MNTPIWSIGVVLFACVIGAFGALFLKLASGKVSMKKLLNKELIWGIFLYGIGSVFFIVALKYGELSVLYPFVATTYIWVALLSIKYLKEKMNWLKWMGIALIIIGVSLIGAA